MCEEQYETSKMNMADSTFGTYGAGKTSGKAAEEGRVEDPQGMDLTLLSVGGLMQTLYLPYPPKGRYYFPEDAPVYFEAAEDTWMARCRGEARLGDEQGRRVSDGLLSHQCMYPVWEKEEEYVLYAEEVNRESHQYHSYVVTSAAPVRIGRLEDNDIVYPVGMVSRHHAALVRSGSAWKIRDEGSANGVFVNGRCVEEAQLRVGDVVSILGLRLVIGSGFFAVNDGNGRLRIAGEKLRRADRALIGALGGTAGNPDERGRNRLFDRFPRRCTVLEERTIAIDAPPMSLSGDQIPLLMRVGGSMVMGGTAALTGNVAMLASSLLLPVLSQRYTKEDREEYERRRKEKYHQYLDEKWEEILNEKEYEEQVLNRNYPELSKVLTYTKKREKLWERRKTDDDFLLLRIGSGSTPLHAQIDYAKRRFELDRDELLDEMYDLAEKKPLLTQVPILLDLKEDRVCGIQGRRQTAMAFMRAMVVRLSLLYSYDEVKMVFLVEEDDLRELEFVRYLPHAWDDQRRVRFVATAPSEAYQTGEYIARSLGKDLEKPRKLKEALKEHPYYLVFAASKGLFDSMEVLKGAMQQEENCGVSVFTVFDNVPKECDVLLKINEPGEEEYGETGECTAVYFRQLDKEDDQFVPDLFEERAALESMADMANISLRLVTEAYTLPKTYTFLEMYGAGRMEHLNIVARWKENNPVNSLAVPIGIGTDGEPFFLDLHQKYQGPHGLVAGTTGSGKSEFLMTYVLSLALNFHPDEVAFVLIDYKGGGLAGAFEDPANQIHLPHLLGTITNLDGSAIARSLISIQSEMVRRQRVFHEAKSRAGEGTMDIYLYQRLYRSGVVPEPMPHLFIISDEFAELKQQQPEFLNQLVSIARIGRSLGVHLILATQKPAGVVTDQIVSNSKFRVCLKVQDKADSMDMLKRPDACEIRETGRFYLQVGSNELFAQGQAAWCGAEYEPQDEVMVQRDDSVQVIDHVGETLLEVKPEKKKQGSGKSQLVSIVRAIMDLAGELHIPRRSLWLPELEKNMDLDQLERMEAVGDTVPSGQICACLGLLDDPEHQRQYRLTVDLERTGHLLVAGASGSGKTTMIQALLLSLARRYSPEQVNFYILDYSSRLLHLFKKLPHCGAVLGEEQEDSLSAFFQMIREIIARRKKLFSQMEVDSYEAACRIRQIPLIFVIIDNLAGMTASPRGQEQYERLQGYLKACGNYGVRYVVTISHLNEASMRVKQEFSGRIGLGLKDKYEYAEMLNCRVTYLPPEVAGRGLYNYEGRPLELQLAMYRPEEEDRERLQDLKEEIESLCRKYSGYPRAKHLPEISPLETYEEFAQRFQGNRIPLGYALKGGAQVALPLKQFSGLSLYFGNPESAAPVLDNLIYGAKREGMGVVFLMRREGSCLERLRHTERLNVFDTTAEGMTRVYQALWVEIKKRREILKAFCEEQGLDYGRSEVYRETFAHMRGQVRPLMVIFESYADACKTAKEEEELQKIYSHIYQWTRRTQIYLAGGFYPDEEGILLTSELYRCFNPDKLVMLFGGSLSRQNLVSLPYELGKIQKPTAYNQCVMHYRGELHTLLMPCGERSRAEEQDEEERSIFEQREEL